MKNILIIGATSKIAQRLKDYMGKEYMYTLTSRHSLALDDGSETHTLDLSSSESLRHFIALHKNHAFDGVFVFAATYNKDPAGDTDFLEQFTKDIVINVVAPITLIRHLNYNEDARVFLFGDAGIHHPKPNDVSYTAAKHTLRHHLKNLAVELAKRKVSILEFALGPTIPNTTDTNLNNYHTRGLFDTFDSADGLIRLLHFILETPSIRMTGTTIHYDGGAYLQRKA